MSEKDLTLRDFETYESGLWEQTDGSKSEGIEQGGGTVEIEGACPGSRQRFGGQFGSRLRDASQDLSVAFDHIQAGMREPGTSPATNLALDALLLMHSVCLHLVYIADDLDTPLVAAQSVSATSQNPTSEGSGTRLEGGQGIAKTASQILDRITGDDPELRALIEAEREDQ